MNYDLYIMFLHNFMNNNIHMWLYNNRLKEGIIPNPFTHLILSDKSNIKINERTIPKTITHFTFGRRFNQKLKKELYQIPLLI